MDLYRELILDHYKHPRNFGHLENPDAVAEGGNATCGDSIRIELTFTPHPSPLITISNIAFSGEGCAISQATASLLTEEVVGKTVEEVMKLQREDITEMLGTELTSSRVKCAMLPLEVLQNALASK